MPAVAAKLNHNDIVLRELRLRPMTSGDFWRGHGISRAAACVHSLREEGWDIVTEFVIVSNRRKEPCRVAYYWLRHKRRLRSRHAERLNGKPRRRPTVINHRRRAKGRA